MGAAVTDYMSQECGKLYTGQLEDNTIRILTILMSICLEHLTDPILPYRYPLILSQARRIVSLNSSHAPLL